MLKKCEQKLIKQKVKKILAKIVRRKKNGHEVNEPQKRGVIDQRKQKHKDKFQQKKETKERLEKTVLNMDIIKNFNVILNIL